MLRKILISLCIMNLFGCASMFGTFSKDETLSGWGAKKTYIGTKIDGASLLVIPICATANTHGCNHGSPALLLAWPFVLVDLPLSFVVDTIMLPYTIYHDHKLEQGPEMSEVKPPTAPKKEFPPPPYMPHHGIPERDGPNFKPFESDTLGLLQEKTSGDV